MPTRAANGVTFHYTEKGSGAERGSAAERGSGAPPLVLLHGFPVDARMWDAQVDALSDAWRVIAPDLRGFGRSQSDTPFTIESLADDVRALLGELGALPCVLAGLSMGGYVALAYANKYPDDLRGLVLIDTKAEADTPEAREGRQKMIDLVRREGAKAVADQMLPKLLPKDAFERRPQAAQSLRRMIEACPPTTIEHALAAMRDRPDRAGELGAVSVPALVLVGEADAVTPPAGAEKMARAMRGAEFVVIRGAGHMAPMEQPEQVNRAVRAFLQRLHQAAP